MLLCLGSGPGWTCPLPAAPCSVSMVTAQPLSSLNSPAQRLRSRKGAGSNRPRPLQLLLGGGDVAVVEARGLQTPHVLHMEP